MTSAGTGRRPLPEEASQVLGATLAGELPHQLLGLRKLVDELVDVLGLCAAPQRDAATATAVD